MEFLPPADGDAGFDRPASGEVWWTPLLLAPWEVPLTAPPCADPLAKGVREALLVDPPCVVVPWLPPVAVPWEGAFALGPRGTLLVVGAVALPPVEAW